MPVRDGNLLRSSRDAIPKRLYKINPFVKGKFVESWRRRRDLFRHSSHQLPIKYIETYG